MDKTKLSQVLNILSPDGTSVDFSDFDANVAKLKEGLKDKIQATTLSEMNRQLDKLRKSLDFTPIAKSVKDIEKQLDDKFTKVSITLDNQLLLLKKELQGTQSSSDTHAETIVADIARLRTELAGIKSYSAEIATIKTRLAALPDLPVAFKDIRDSIKALEDKNAESDFTSIAEISDEIEKLRRELNNRISNLPHGGNANRNIAVDSNTSVLSTFTDINWISGANITLTAVKNQVTKYTDITIAASVSGGGGSVVGTPGGSDTQVQFNDNGVFGGASVLTWNKNTSVLALNGTEKVTNAGTANALSITQLGNTSASISVGGALNINNTLNTGAGLVLYSNHGAGQVGRQLVVYSQASALTIDTALIQSDATNNTALNVKGVPTGKGVIKIEHLGNTAGDANAAAVSIDLQGSGTAAQGIRVDATNGGTTGDLIGLYNAGVERFTVGPTGIMKVNNAYTFPTADGTANFALVTNGAGALSFASVAGVGGSGITRVASIISVSSTLAAAASTDYVAFANVGIAITLPTAIGNSNLYTVKNISSSSVLIKTTAGQSIDGSATALMPVQNQTLGFISNASVWQVV